MTESRSELAHTPLPWQCATKFSSGLGVPVLNNQGQRVCNTGDAAWKADDKEYQGRALANAAFIVRAVNSHDANEAKIAALVKALEDARRDLLALKSKSDIGSLRNRQIEASAKRIADAIALASSKAVQL